MPTANQWQMPEELRAQLGAAYSALNDFLTDTRDTFDARSERWREGDTGTAVEGWLSDLDDLAESLENVDHTPPDLS